MKRSILKLILILVPLGLIASGISIFLSAHSLTVSRYEVTTPLLTDTVRIVQLTDLHNSEFGEHNQRLVQKVAEQAPDLIAITGDLLNSNVQRLDIAQELIAQLAALAPVYVSYGNHEIMYQDAYGTDLRALYSASGATVLEYEWAELCVKGQSIRLGGIYGYCMPAHYLDIGGADEAECAFLSAFQDTEAYTVLLCHMPYSWIVHDSLEAWEIDCVLCGHVHGGQIRFPFLGGLWAPDQGWFPGRESGLYRSEDGSRVMLLSRGLGNTDRLPRMNNLPEILVLNLLPA